MFIREIYDNKKCVVSLEVFPPKRKDSMETVFPVMEKLCSLAPDFISVTCGAGGSSQDDKTLGLASMVKNRFGVEAMAHLTSITATKQQMEKKLTQMQHNDIENILALRGDPPMDSSTVTSDYRFAKDLIADIQGKGFCIGATCYPEGHISCLDLETNIDHLKQKQEAGAEFLVSQLFFDNKAFYEFLELARKRGVRLPVSAGIMPMMSADQVKRMIFMCGASLPSKIVKILHRYQDDPDSLFEAGMDYAGRQIEDLRQHRIEGIHIYTMNRPNVAQRLIEVARAR